MVEPKTETGTITGRSPRGECGLKLLGFQHYSRGILSLPSRGVWIEMMLSSTVSVTFWSLPSRGVWIEMVLKVFNDRVVIVAPLAGSVD